MKIAVMGQLMTGADDRPSRVAINLGGVTGDEEGRGQVVVLQQLQHPINADPRAVDSARAHGQAGFGLVAIRRVGVEIEGQTQRAARVARPDATLLLERIFVRRPPRALAANRLSRPSAFHHHRLVRLCRSLLTARGFGSQAGAYFVEGGAKGLRDKLDLLVADHERRRDHDRVAAPLRRHPSRRIDE